MNLYELWGGAVRSVLSALLLGAFTVQLAIGADWNPERRVLSSSSGEYQLEVVPRNPNGSGAADYTLKRKNVVVWSGEQPVCLRDAVVLDDGRVVGHAYERGVIDTVWHGLRYLGLTVVLLDAKGEFVLRDSGADHETGKIDSASIMSHSDSPIVEGYIVDLEHDRFTLRVYPPMGAAGYPSVWWNYRLSTGEALGDVFSVPPKQNRVGFAREIAAQVVPGTPLVLVHWYVHEWTPKKRGAALSLVNENGEVQWTKALPNEYDSQAEDWSWGDLIRARTNQIKTDKNSFSFRSIRTGPLMEFSIHVDTETDSGYRVAQSAQKRE